MPSSPHGFYFQRTWLDFTARAADVPDDARAAWEFCRAWRQGQETFTLRTSGSTGPPKPIVLTRSQMEASAHLTGRALGLRAGHRALVCLPSAYVAGTMMLVRGLVLGLELHLWPPAANPLRPLRPDDALDFAACVPLQLQTALDETPDRLPVLDHMRAVLLGGAPLPAGLEARLGAIRAAVYHTYGMTETVSHVALRRLNGPERSDHFTALPGVTLGTDARGCLTVRAAVTRYQLLVTSDRIELLDERRFRWLGRADLVINSGGVKVQPEVVEAALETWLAAADAGRRLFVAARADPRLGEAVTLYVEGSAPLPNGWQEALRNQLPPHHVPRAVQYVARFRQTATGKTDPRATAADAATGQP